MTERKRTTRTPSGGERKRGEEATGHGKRRPRTGREDVDVTWDQPQPRYPAPERPLDQAEERKRSA